MRSISMKKKYAAMAVGARAADEAFRAARPSVFQGMKGTVIWP